MTSFVPLTPARQPFGVLNESRLQGLTSLKNRQNAQPALNLASPLKRRVTDDLFADENSENIDPVSFGSSAKKSKHTLSLAQPAPPLKSISSAFTFSTPQALSQTRNPKDFSAPRPIQTPASPAARLRGKTAAPSNANSTPLTAPAAGRSPKSKRIGILSRRRVSSSPFTRVDPPRSLSNTPFSIDAALESTFNLFNAFPAPSSAPAPTPTPMLEETTSTEWNIRRLQPSDPGMSAALFFDIHEDTEEAHLTNLMEHSTNVLDISDDEGLKTAKSARGKENVPPLDFGGSESSALQTTSIPLMDPASLPLPPSPSSNTRRRKHKEAMLEGCDDQRAPLGELNPADYSQDEGEVEVVQENEREGAEVSAPSKEAFEVRGEGVESSLDSVPLPSSETQPKLELDLGPVMQLPEEAAKDLVVQVENKGSAIEIYVDNADVVMSLPPTL
ncbi:MAG: hypothetical protein M1814_005713 [Vezdaea aestivalis]|nr:MAG: hypothetical protein M1814_005713 [Vezdaea aestivalis]